jgi:hypothetical protein
VKLKTGIITLSIILTSWFSGCGNRNNDVGPEENPQPSDLIADGVSLIRNGDFENEFEIAWYWDSYFNESIQICDMGRAGSKAAVITLAQNKCNSGFGQTFSWSNSSHYLLVRGWVKAEQQVENWRFCVSCGNEKYQYDKNGKEIYGCLNSNEIIHPLSGQSEDWKLYEIGIYVPEKTIDVSVSLWSQGTSGKVLIDDIEVRPAKLRSDTGMKSD